MATLRLLLDKTRALKKGYYPLVFRIIHRRRKRIIYTSYKLLIEEYDPIEEQVIYISEAHRPQKAVNSINKAIIAQHTSLKFHIKELDMMERDYVVDNVMSRYHIEHDDLSLLGYIDRLICEKLNIEKTGIAIAYQSTRSSLARFIDNRPINFSDVDSIFVRSYEHHLMQRGIKSNTICFYMRNFKSIYTQALYDGMDTPKQSPFRGISCKPQKTVKRALNSDTIRSIKSIKLVGIRKHFNASRDLFLFSFLTRGMPFVDMFHLKKTSIKNDIITYCRRKTGQWLQVALTNEAKKIIERYETEGEYIFPMHDKITTSTPRKTYALCLEKTNRHLKEIGKSLDLELPLTTYVARHCWATQAKECGFSTSVISEGLGHSSEKITQIYLKDFDHAILDKANEKITKALFT